MSRKDPSKDLRKLGLCRFTFTETRSTGHNNAPRTWEVFAKDVKSAAVMVGLIGWTCESETDDDYGEDCMDMWNYSPPENCPVLEGVLHSIRVEKYTELADEFVVKVD